MEEKLSKQPGSDSFDDRPFQLKVVYALAKRYLVKFKWLTFSYILLTILCRPLLPVAIGLNLSQLTNFFQQAQVDSRGDRALINHGSSSQPVNSSLRPEGPARVPANLLATYLSWLLLSIAFLATGALLRYLTSNLDGKMANAMRADTFDSILHQPPGFFFEYDQNRLTMVVNQFCTQAQLGVRQLMVDPLLQILGIIIAGWTLYAQLVALQGNGGGSASLSFVCISVFALISPLLINSLGRFLQRETSAFQKSTLRLASLVGGALASYEEVQAARAEKILCQKHDVLLDDLLRSRLNQSIITEKLNALNAAPGTLVLAALLGTAVYLTLFNKGGNPGNVVALAVITPQFMSQIQALSSVTITGRTTWPGLALVTSILERSPSANEAEDSEKRSDLEGTLAASNIVFSYPGPKTRNVLDDVSFHIPAGMKVGLVARPGQGKTTFFRLALRFYEPQGGEILLGGRPVRTLDFGTVRTNIVLMSQFPGFFHDSVRENFRISAPAAPDEEIIAISEKTGLWDVLRTIFGDHPLDEPFDAAGRLSGGQRKLFALTRCLLRDPRILLLDEPTTGMGPLEKYPLIEVMQHACTGRTVFLVDHDIIWQSRFCDYVLVLQTGKIIQEGTPQELRLRDGLFRTLYHEASQQTS
jgi:ABC-type multidrug transport system fused ATPase/permease subunit